MDSSISGSGVIDRMRFRMENAMIEQIKRTLKLLFLFFLFWFIFVCLQYLGYAVVTIADYDTIARAVHKNVGNKVKFRGKEILETEVTQYNFLIHDSRDENLLADMVDAVNEKIEEKSTQEKVSLVIREEITGGGEMPIITLYNYNYGFICPYICHIVISGNQVADYSSYNRPASYPALEGIEYLRVIDKVNKNAEEEGIDWYEVFPDLKGYEVYKRENGESTIVYQEMKEDEASEDSEETEVP